MTDEVREYYEKKQVELLEEMLKWDPGSPERKEIKEEIKEVCHTLNEDLKIRQDAWDAEESRKNDQEKVDKQMKSERRKVVISGIFSILAAATTGGMAYAGLKSTQNFKIKAARSDYFIDEKLLPEQTPKFKWFR